jgi:hypothetical protein
VIDVIAPDGSNLKEDDEKVSLKDMKISSTAIRQWIAEQREKEEKEKPERTDEGKSGQAASGVVEKELPPPPPPKDEAKPTVQHQHAEYAPAVFPKSFLPAEPEESNDEV